MKKIISQILWEKKKRGTNSKFECLGKFALYYELRDQAGAFDGVFKGTVGWNVLVQAFIMDWFHLIPPITIAKSLLSLEKESTQKNEQRDNDFKDPKKQETIYDFFSFDVRKRCHALPHYTK